MNAESAQQIAEQFIRDQTGRALRSQGPPRPDPLDARRWLVLFEWKTSEGHRVDGPVVVRVDNATGKAEFLPSL